MSINPKTCGFAVTLVSTKAYQTYCAKKKQKAIPIYYVNSCFASSFSSTKTKPRQLSTYQKINQKKTVDFSTKSFAWNHFLPPKVTSTSDLMIDWKNLDAPINDKGQTHLHICVINRDVFVTAILLKNGASANIIDKIGNSPLHLAVIDVNPSKKLILTLLQGRADPTIKNGANKDSFELSNDADILELLKRKRRF